MIHRYPLHEQSVETLFETLQYCFGHVERDSVLECHSLLIRVRSCTHRELRCCDNYAMNTPTNPPKTPPPPMSRASSFPTSTPISNKVSGSHIYASQVLDRTNMNVALAKEMEGHLGGCPTQQFLDKYLPLKAGIKSQELRKNQLKGHFNAVASARSEFEMYQPFVRPFNDSYPSFHAKYFVAGQISKVSGSRHGLHRYTFQPRYRMRQACARHCWVL